MKRSGPRLRAALCDLDGTLLDTAPDLAEAVNRTLRELGLPCRTLQQVTNDIGRGTPKLVERSLAAGARPGADADRRLFERALRLFSQYYDEESGRASRPFPGVMAGLQAMADHGVALACVTNKPRRFTVPLLERTGLARWFQTIVCGDEVEHLKPHPAAFLEACLRLHLLPEEAVVIGDSSNDVVAGKAAGCAVLCVPYGYREGESLDALDAEVIVQDLREAAAWLRAQ